jgi:hypothetical protein
MIQRSPAALGADVQVVAPAVDRCRAVQHHMVLAGFRLEDGVEGAVGVEYPRIVSTDLDRFNWQKTLSSPHMVTPSLVFVACDERPLTGLAPAVKGVQN